MPDFMLTAKKNVAGIVLRRRFSFRTNYFVFYGSVYRRTPYHSTVNVNVVV